MTMKVTRCEFLFNLTCKQASARMIELENENERLRELVHDMWQTISSDDGCDWDMDENCCTSDECNVSCRYWHRMKELGIEVGIDE